jgi:hypothetical protein
LTAKTKVALPPSLQAAGLSIQLLVEYRVDNDRVWVFPFQLLKIEVLRRPLESAQYASAAYVDLLLQHSMIPSMSRPGNPYDNAKCERFMKTLKQEEIRCFEYKDIEDLRANLRLFFDRYYNAARLHSALGYRSPDEFERQAAASTKPEILRAPSVSFKRHEEIYPPDVRP